MSAGKLSGDTAKRIATTRQKFLDADAAIHGSRAFGPDREHSAIETLVIARHDYQKALDKGERELGLRA